MISIPLGLLEQVERGNVLLFIGERVVRDANGHVAIDQLALRLAARCGVTEPEEYSFVEAAQAYEDELGRQALVQFVHDELEQAGDEPQRVHRLIAGLTHCKVLVTTCFDRRLERACAEVGRPLHLVVGGIEVAFEDEQKTRLYKLRGSVERIESLVLTEEDYERFFEAHASMSLVLKAYLASKTILFIGYDLADPQFRNLYSRVIDLLDNHNRRAYAFGEAPAQPVARWCKRHGIEVVETGATDFLEALTAQLATRERSEPGAGPHAEAHHKGYRPWTQGETSDETPALPLPERPYKLLAPYNPEDAAIFFGREQETLTLTSLIHAHRLLLFYGVSSAGKTSLLLAGVVPRLAHADPPYTTLYVRGRSDPARVIRHELQRRLPAAHLPQAGSLTDLLTAATTALTHPLVILLDQFEEFFVAGEASPSRQAFIAELGDLYDARAVPVKLVFSLREDWLAALSEFEARIPEIYRIKMRLLPLAREQASQAITRPMQQIGVEYAPRLVEQVLDDLTAATLHGLSKPTQAYVMPPQLQLVCSALYERAHSQGRLWIDLEDYAAVGATEGILARYIEESLQEHPGVERAAAKALLLALVSVQATRLTCTLPDLTARTGIASEIAEKALARLLRQQLVQRLGDDQRYELSHDVLAAALADWIGTEDRQLKRIQEQLLRELADWQQDPRLLPSQSKFQQINDVRELLRLTAAEVVLLLRTALLYNEDIPYWLAQVQNLDDQVKILLETLHAEPTPARQTAATVLAAFSQDAVAAELVHTALVDPEASVRETAAVSLGQMHSRYGVDRLVTTVYEGETEARARALRALALIADVAPNTLLATAGFPWPLVYDELVKLRFGRNWPRIRMVTVAGAIGGAVGFALGFTPLLSLEEASILGKEEAIKDVLVFVLLAAFFGFIPGAGVAFGFSVGGALLREKTKLGSVLGSTVMGLLGFTATLTPLIIANHRGVMAGLVGGGLLGVMIGCGLALSLLSTQRQLVQLSGGAVSAIMGVILFTSQYSPEFFRFAGYMAVVVVSGGTLGLIMTFAIGWAAARWPLAEKIL